jgi:hypothetical protein
MLFEDLLRRKFYAVGTARQGRVGFPSSLDIMDKGARGTLEVWIHKDRRMATLHWSDTKGVHFLSTVVELVKQHGMHVKRTLGGKKILFPTLPIQIMYATNMFGIDTQDQVWASYSTQLNTKKWWHRLFFFALDATFANSFQMYKHMCLDRGGEAHVPCRIQDGGLPFPHGNTLANQLYEAPAAN